MCELTDNAMNALIQVAERLDVNQSELSAIELRTLMWARCSLAALYGIRIDEIAHELLPDPAALP